jgi:hypothetical protein
MIYILSDNAGVICVISWQKPKAFTCEVESLPDDFMFYLSRGKYLANESGLYIADGWKDYTPEEVTGILAYESDNEGFESYDLYAAAKRAQTYSFFIIPLDIVSQIKHYSAWVKEAYPEKIFDVVLNSEEIDVEGQMITVPTNVLKMIPCGITRFNEDGELLLEAVIEYWNSLVPSKAIDFNVKFYSLSELTQFIESCGSTR